MAGIALIFTMAWVPKLQIPSRLHTEWVEQPSRRLTEVFGQSSRDLDFEVMMGGWFMFEVVVLAIWEGEKSGSFWRTKEHVDWWTSGLGPAVACGGSVHWVAAIMIPLCVFFAGGVSCEHGMPWEAHMVYYVIVMIWKTTEYLPYEFARCPGIGVFPVVLSFVSSIFAALDFYTDLNFVLIAFTCKWDKAWISLTIYLVGVIVCQVAIPAYLWLLPEPPHPASPLGTQKLFCSELMGEMTIQRGSNAIPSKYFNAGGSLCFTIVRVFFEDVPQCFMQILFCMEVKPSKFVYFSIMISLGMGFKSLWDACENCTESSKYDRLK